jgi:transposase-like protein
MAQDHRRLAEEVVQGVLLDDPTFLREIVERVLQELLEAEMNTHIGAAPYERSESRKRGIAMATRPGHSGPGWAPSTCSFPRR